ncbi:MULTISPECIES: hypothetical protein [unclassified Moorena]|nr:MULTISPECIES: hypothetical protein [unclassified Moorena]
MYLRYTRIPEIILPTPRACAYTRRIKFVTGSTAPDSRLPTQL